MTGEELDRRLREIFAAVTPETILSRAADMAKLGFGPMQSFEILSKIIRDRPKAKKGKK